MSGDDLEYLFSYSATVISDEELKGLAQSDRDILTSELAKLDWVEVEEYLPELPSDTLGILIPKTRIVLNSPPFAHGFLKVLLSALVVNSNDTWPAYMLAIAAVGDAIRDLKTSIHKLELNNGEACSYKSIYEKSWDFFDSLTPKEIQKKDAWKDHEAIRSVCEIESCKFHQNGCELKRGKFDDILDQLTNKGLLIESSDEKSVRVFS